MGALPTGVRAELWRRIAAANNYTDAQFLIALRDCQSAPVRKLVVQLDSIAGFLRFDAIGPFDAAEQLNDISMSLLELAAAKRRKATA